MSSLPSLAMIAYERGIAAAVLSTVVEATPVIGRAPSRSFVACALVGSVRRDILAADAHRLTTYGALQPFGLDAVYEFVDGLVRAGYLETLRSRVGLVVTAAGRDLLLGLERAATDGRLAGPPLGLLRGAVDPAALDLAVRAGLVDALRRYRAAVAHEREVREHAVLPETRLREIAACLPSTLAALEDLGVVGGVLVECGPELLRIVAEHAPIVERLKNAQVTR